MNFRGKLKIDFPTSPADKSGWPWTEESPSFDPVMTDGKPWPKISIVTPSFNQGKFLEETIRSVLLQNYPNLEYIIIDGGSADNSIDIIKKYEPWLDYWVSEKDNGQAHAINKGLERCAGEIFNWINSDDYLTSGALKIVAENIKDVDMLAGTVMNFNGKDETVTRPFGLSIRKMIRKKGGTVSYHQPGIWLRTGKLKHVGGLNEDFHYMFDWLMMMHYLAKYPTINYVSEVLAKFRLHKNSKTVKNGTGFTNDLLRLSVMLMYNKDYREYRFEAIKCAQDRLRKMGIDEIEANESSDFSKVISIIKMLFSNVFSYPYRYALGTIKRILIK